MSARGISARQVLAGTELQPEQVQGVFRGTPANYRAIIGNMLQLTGDPYLGIALGSEFRISDFGVLGYAVLSSATLRQSRSVMAKYYTLNEHIIRPEVTIDERRWCIGITRNLPARAPPAVCGRGVCQPRDGTRLYADKRAFSREVAAPRVSGAGRSHRLSAPLRLPDVLRAAEDAAVHFDVARLEASISLANEEVFKVCERQCQLTANRISASSSLAAQIRDALIGAPGEFPAMEQMAQQLGTTHRALAAACSPRGSRLRASWTKTREDLARQYLKYTGLTPKEIAFLLGYSDVSNFRRAFRGWTGGKDATIAEGQRRAASSSAAV